jgi:ribosomal protein L4
VHAERGTLAVLDAAGLDAPSTKKGAELLGDRLGGHVLLFVDSTQEVAAKCFRNLERVLVMPADQTHVADVVRATSVVFSREALDQVTALAAKPTKRAGTAEITEEATA